MEHFPRSTGRRQIAMMEIIFYFQVCIVLWYGTNRRKREPLPLERPLSTIQKLLINNINTLLFNPTKRPVLYDNR